MLQKLEAWLKKKKIPLRLIIAVAAGIVLSKVLLLAIHLILHKLHVFPQLGEPLLYTRKLVLALVFHSICAVIAAYVTAHIAREYANKAVFVLGTKEAILWLLGIILLWHQAPPWFNLTKAVLGIPLSLFGGWLYKQTYGKSHDLN